MIQCTCPVCNQTGEYPQRYAHKWHRCKLGCRAIRTRMVIVPGGTGVLEEEVAEDWKEVIQRGKRVRWIAAAVGALLVPLPFLATALGLPWVVALGLAGVGAGVTAWGVSALTYACPKPAGL